MKKIILVLMMALILAGCSNKTEETKGEEKENQSVVSGASGDYSILIPYKTSPLRQAYAASYREIDMMEIGGRLQEKTKEVYDPGKYYISDGSKITRDRYENLKKRKSDKNTIGLNLESGQSYTEVITMPDKSKKEVVIPDPVFVSDIYELNFHKTKNPEAIDGTAFALVLKRNQIIDAEHGTIHRLADDTLFEVASIAIGRQFEAYLRTLDGMSDVPIYIAFYVQESDLDNLPGKYTPGHYIGHGYFESERSGGDFVRDNESWVMLNTTEASNNYSEVYNEFNLFNRTVSTFMKDEHVGVVGQIFTVKNKPEKMKIELTTGAKTYQEIYGLVQYTADELSRFDNFQMPITVDVKIFQNTQATITKRPGQTPVIQFIN